MLRTDEDKLEARRQRQEFMRRYQAENIEVASA
jgi:hypothetical protein